MVDTVVFDRNMAVEIKNSIGFIQKVSFADVKKILCPDANDAEVVLFLKQAEAEQLNPFLKEIELIKYDSSKPASIVIRFDARLKAAESRKEFAYALSGIIIQTGDNERWIQGTYYNPQKDKLMGGWAKVFIKGRPQPVFSAVNFNEVVKCTRDGHPNVFWREQPAMMVRKVAYSRALREAFPSLFHGPISPVEADKEPETEGDFHEVENPGEPAISGQKEIEKPDGGLPEAFIGTDGKPRWDYFWSKLKEQFGIDHSTALTLVKISSFSETYGTELGRAWEDITKALNAGRREEPTESKLVQEAIKAGGVVEPIGTAKVTYSVPTDKNGVLKPEGTTAAKEAVKVSASTASTEKSSDELFDELESASNKQKAPEGFKLNIDWAIASMKALREMKVDDVSSQSLVKKFTGQYKLSIPPHAKMPDVLAMLSTENAFDMASWLMDLKKKAGIPD